MPSVRRSGGSAARRILAVNIYMLFAAQAYPRFIQAGLQRIALRYLLFAVINSYLGLVGTAALTVASEWKRIPGSAFDKVKYLWAFPFYLVSYIPIAVCALFRKVKWEPIRHYSRIQLSGKT